MAVLRADERPSIAFWLSSGVGVIAVLIFAAAQGLDDYRVLIYYFVAVLLAALGYAEGGRLSRKLGGWRVICWALILAAPVIILPVALAIGRQGLTAGTSAWLGFAYVSSISMFLAFFAWYRGLALGGIARIGQIQLLQPVLTLVWSALLLGNESICRP
jgi:drug/metabolite transporter (DMT)-like permease